MTETPTKEQVFRYDLNHFESRRLVLALWDSTRAGTKFGPTAAAFGVSEETIEDIVYGTGAFSAEQVEALENKGINVLAVLFADQAKELHEIMADERAGIVSRKLDKKALRDAAALVEKAIQDLCTLKKA